MAKLYKATGEIIEVEPKNGSDFSLEELQSFVGGPIETVPLTDEEYMIVNEEGKLRNLLYNSAATKIYNEALDWDGDWIVGDALVCRKTQIK